MQCTITAGDTGPGFTCSLVRSSEVKSTIIFRFNDISRTHPRCVITRKVLYPIAGAEHAAPQHASRGTSSTVTSSKSAGRRSSTVLRNGYLKIGYSLWHKEEEDLRKGFNVVCTLTLPNTSCISEQFKDIQEVISLILHCRTLYCRRTSPSTSTTSEI